VPKHRLTGLPFGTARSTRRGRGSDLAGFRTYVPGDPISTIDWRASARLSTARADDEFVVRERFAEEAPSVVVLADRRPSMGLYPDWSPWLQKPEAVRVATVAIIESALAARGAAGYLDLATRPDGTRDPFWLPPRSRSPLETAEERLRTAAFDAEPGSLAAALDHLVHMPAAGLGAGSFVFVLSDFLEPPPPALWLAAAARRWELVPVVIQDPVWEASFPELPGVVVPMADPASGRVLEARLTRGEARAERARREAARAALLKAATGRGLDPVVLERSDETAVVGTFLGWAERRRRALWERR